ncbi:MAG: asparagine synthetase B family protein [Candidatus Thiodiazotropha sp.]
MTDNNTFIKSKNMRIPPVMVGFAGVIRLDGQSHDLKKELDLIDNQFAKSESTSKAVWLGENVAALSYQNTQESKTDSDVKEYTIPVLDGLQGVLHGSLFEQEQSHDHIKSSLRLLEIYRQNDVSKFQTINGAWAGFIFDSKTKTISFIRDRIGIQTLNVIKHGESVYFATDLRLLRNSVALNIDSQSIAELCHYLYVPAPLTMYKNCTAVLPGHILQIDSQFKQKKYSKDRFVIGDSLNDDNRINEAIEKQLPNFENHLIKAVTDCLPEQGRIALTLSGGKDSSALAIALSKICPDRVVALTIGQSEKRSDETKDARKVCKALGLQHISYYPTDDEIEEGFYKFTALSDQPIGDPATLPYFLGMTKLPDDCNLILDGTGNDYYFGVSSVPRGIWKYQKRIDIEDRVPKYLWRTVLGAMKLTTSNMRNLAKNWDMPIEEAFVAWQGWSSKELEDLLDREVSFEHTYLWNVMGRRKSMTRIELETEVICGVWEPHTAYRKAHYLAHALGKGIRFPFTDNRLAEYINDLPEELKLKNNVNKQILRAYLKANLPEEIVNKKKMGFVFNINRILEDSSYKWIDYLVNYKEELFSNNAKSIIDKLLKDYRDNPNDPSNQHRLYALMLLAFVLASKDEIQLEY